MKTNARGFYIYDEFKDSYQADVRVVESSSALGPRVWIFCEGLNPTSGDREDRSPHLNKEQATRLMEALQTWINQIPERWGDVC